MIKHSDSKWRETQNGRHKMLFVAHFMQRLSRRPSGRRTLGRCLHTPQLRCSLELGKMKVVRICRAESWKHNSCRCVSFLQELSKALQMHEFSLELSKAPNSTCMQGDYFSPGGKSYKRNRGNRALCSQRTWSSVYFSKSQW